MNLRLVLLGLTLCLTSMPVHAAGDPAIGATLATPCAACHGEAGASPITNNPVIAGQHLSYLLHAMESYQTGKRTNAIMIQQMVNLSQQDIENLAAYFAALPSPLK